MTRDQPLGYMSLGEAYALLARAADEERQREAAAERARHAAERAAGCAADGHPAAHQITTMSDPGPVWLCRCGTTIRREESSQ